MRLPYDETGDGPAVVLLHAGIADRGMWREHLEPLAAAGYRVVALDLPEFGEAPPPRERFAPWDDVLETMEALGIERAALVGNSFGGAVALRVAVLAPERVSAVVLISAPPPELEPSAELQAAWKAEEAAAERGDIDAAVQSVVDAWTLPDAPADLRERVAAMQRRALLTQIAAGEVPAAPDPLEEDPARLAEIRVPVLVAAGEREPFVDFRQGAEALVRAIPHAQHAVIEGAGHLAPLEAPDAFRELLLDFLRVPTTA